MRVEQLRKFADRTVGVLRKAGLPLADPAELDVEVADYPKLSGQPSELLADTDRTEGQDAGKQTKCSTHTPRRHSHLMECLDVLAEPRPWLVRQHGGSVLAQRRVGELARRRLLRHSSRAEIGQAGDADARSHQTGLELRQRRRPQTALPAQLLNEWLYGVDERGRHLELDPLQPQLAPLGAGGNDGVVQRQLRHMLPVQRQLK